MIIVYTILTLISLATTLLYYKLRRTEKALRDELKKNNKSLVDAGNAITDTLKIIFDNLKRTTQKQDKQANELHQTTNRIHRIEQQFNRIKYSEEIENKNPIEETKNERRKSKTN